MSVSASDIAFMEDLFAPFGAITCRKMMGYRTLPDDALEDPQAASDWGRRALANL